MKRDPEVDSGSAGAVGGHIRHGHGSACGKAIVVGEHFVLWGGTALAIPIRSAEMKVHVEVSPAARTRVVAQQGEILARGALRGLKFLGWKERAELRIRVEATFPPAAGLGASAAFSVAFCRAMLSMTGETLDEDLVAQASLEMERVFHVHPSGIDSATVAFDSPAFVKSGSRFIAKGPGGNKGPLVGFLDIAPGAVFLLADSGERSRTKDAVGKVFAMASQPGGARVLRKLTAVAESIALQVATALKIGDFEYVGIMMKENHYLLKALGVSTDRLDSLQKTALKAGALGAKLTGAGMGGFLLALALPEQAEAVKTALSAAGAKTIFEQPSGF